MSSMLRRAAAPVLIGAVAGLGAIACTHAPHPTAAESAANRHALAQMHAYTCFTDLSPMGQLTLIKSLSTHAGREDLMNRCGIPASKRPAAEAQILSAAEKGHLLTPGGRQIFIETTLPNILEANQG